MNRLHAAAPGVVIVASLVACCGDTTGETNTFAPLSCTTAMIPDHAPPLSFTDQFAIDTGLAPYQSIGAGYGQSDCEHYLLVSVDLTSMVLVHKNVFISDSWSNTFSVARSNCIQLDATMVVFGRPSGGAFQILDEVSSKSLIQGGLCNATTTHTNPADEGSGGTFVPAGMFAELRIAVEATQNGQKVDAQIIGSIVP